MIKRKIILSITIILTFQSVTLAQELIKSFASEEKFKQLNSASKTISNTIDLIINSADFSDREQRKNAIKLIESLTAQQKEIKNFADSMLALKKASLEDRLWEFADGMSSGEKEFELVQKGTKGFNAILQYCNSADKMRDMIIVGGENSFVYALPEIAKMPNDLKEYGKADNSLTDELFSLLNSSKELVLKELSDEKSIDISDIEDICRSITHEARDSEFKSEYTSKFWKNIAEAKAKITLMEFQINLDYKDAERLSNLALEAKKDGDFEKAAAYLKEAREFLISAEKKNDEVKQYAELTPVLKLNVTLPDNWRGLQDDVSKEYVSLAAYIVELINKANESLSSQKEKEEAKWKYVDYLMDGRIGGRRPAFDTPGLRPEDQFREIDERNKNQQELCNYTAVQHLVNDIYTYGIYAVSDIEAAFERGADLEELSQKFGFYSSEIDNRLSNLENTLNNYPEFQGRYDITLVRESLQKMGANLNESSGRQGGGEKD